MYTNRLLRQNTAAGQSVMIQTYTGRTVKAFSYFRPFPVIVIYSHKKINSLSIFFYFFTFKTAAHTACPASRDILFKINVEIRNKLCYNLNVRPIFDIEYGLIRHDGVK